MNKDTHDNLQPFYGNRQYRFNLFQRQKGGFDTRIKHDGYPKQAMGFRTEAE